MSDRHHWQDHGETNDEVATSRELWSPLADAMGGFDLDPAAGCEPTPIATDRYTVDDDGLTTPWYGTVWLNPPFSEKLPWYRRAVNQYERPAVDAVVAVGPVDTSTDWFQDWFTRADIVAFLNGRDWYVSAGRQPNFSTAVAVWNPTGDAIDWLQSVGTVVQTLGDSQATIGQF